MSLGSEYVPAYGTDNTNLMLVGEAPGKDEVAEKEPFVGRSGKRLVHVLQRYNVQKKEAFLTNLCHYRPKGNKFAHCLDTPQLADGLAELEQAIRDIRPNCIVALGGWPTYFLTGSHGSQGPGSGITALRGSILPGSLVQGTKVISTLHPAFVERSPWNKRMGPTAPLFDGDIKRAVGDSAFPDLRYPEYTSFIDPPEDEILPLVSAIHEAEWVSVDIETFGNELACVGFCCDPSWALTLTAENPAVNWPICEALLQSNTKKIFQFGTFDIRWMQRFMDWGTRNYSFDTYIASATLLPEFKRGLDFLTSVYTRIPYYKDERKKWKNTGDLTVLWEYNIKDVIATLLIALGQMKELEKDFGWTPEQHLLEAA